MCVVPVAVVVTKTNVGETDRHADAVARSIEPAIVCVTMHDAARCCSGARKHECHGQAFKNHGHGNLPFVTSHGGDATIDLARKGATPFNERVCAGAHAQSEQYRSTL